MPQPDREPALQATGPGPHAGAAPVLPIKCVVWDLDNTLWQGTLAEGDELVVTETVRKTIAELDARGILQSIASKNDHATAWQRLVGFQLDPYFVHPQINWRNKSDSLRNIIEALGIGADAVALLDDQAFERDEVQFQLSQVTVIDAARIAELLDWPALKPAVVSAESRQRRRMVQADIRRHQDEQEYAGPRHEFLATLGMSMTIRRATEHDLQRAEELTLRSNQLNATGTIHSRAELEALLLADDHDLLVAELDDRYGSSGVIGLALVRRGAGAWLLRLLIVSCRVLSRGAGGILLTYILQSAASQTVSLRAEYVPTGRNRLMYMTYKFSGFVEAGERDGVILLEHTLENIRPFPSYVAVNAGCHHAE